MEDKTENETQETSEAEEESDLEEEIEEEYQKEDEQFQDFSEFEQTFSEERTAPILETTNQVQDIDSSDQTIEDIAETSPTTNSINQEEQDFNYVLNAPDYAGSDYENLAKYENREEEEIIIPRDREINIAPRLMHREPQPTQQQEINLREWRGTAGGLDETTKRDESQDYLTRKLRKRKEDEDKLPFQQ